MRLIILIALALPALAQVRFPGVTIYPSSNDVSTGQLQFLTRRSDGNSVQIQAPTTGASYTLTLPTAVAATNGDCLVSTTTGVLSFAACGGGGGGNWIASGFASSHSGGAVSIRNGYGASTLNGAINSSVTTIAVTDGSSFINNKHIRIDSEVMLIIGISGNDLTVTRGVNYSAAASHADGATVGTAGFLEVQQSDGVYPWRLSNGMWYTGAVPYFRPTAAGAGILDVSSNGFADAWIDICGTDVETGIAAFECLELRTNRSEDGGSTYGHVGMKANGSGVSVRDLAINENGAQVTIGGNTFSNSLRVQASATDAKGITIYGTAAPGLEITNGTNFVYVGLSTGTNKYFPDSADGNLALRSSNGIGFTADAGTTTHLRISGGASRFNTHITTGAASAFDIGDASNYFQTIYAENFDGAPAGVTGNYAIFRKIEVADQAGGTNKWDFQANAASASSSLFIRDQSGNKVIEFFRVVSSAPADYADVYVDLLPDVNGSQRLGSSSKRWQTAYIQDLDISGGSVYGHLVPITDDTYRLGDSVKRWSETWTDNFSATGTVKLGTSSTIGHVWTATDASGNGTWSAVPGGVATSRLIATSSPLSGGGDLSADRTLSCPTCFTTSGGTISGAVTVNNGINSGATITDGTAVGIMFASSALTNSIVFGTTSAHPLAVFSGNNFHTAFWPSGNTCIGCTNDANKLEVTGNTLLTGNLTFTGTLNTAISTTELSYLDGVTSAIQTQLNARVATTRTISTTSPITGGGDLSADRTFACATCATTDTTQTISGSKTFSGAVTMAANLLSNSASAWDIGSSVNYFQTLYVENIDAAPSGITNNYTKVRKLEIADQAGGTNFWDVQTSATGASSFLRIRDQAGGDVITFYRVVASSPADYADVFVDLLPNVNGSQRLGSSAKRWQTAYVQDLDISGGSVYGHLTPITTNVYRLGEPSSRWAEANIVKLDASGTVKLGTSSTVGQVWTATDTAGNGNWGAAGVTSARTISTSSPLSGGGDLSANRTLSCPTCFTTSGGSLSGGVSPDSTNTYDLGGASFRWRNAHIRDVYIYGAAVAPDGNFGATETITVRNAAGTGTCTLVFSGGIKTSGTC